MCELHIKILNIYNTGLNDFLKRIPDDYEQKQTICKECSKILINLIYDSPKHLTSKFNYYIKKICKKFLPDPETKCSNDAWRIICEVSIKTQKILIKEYENMIL